MDALFNLIPGWQEMYPLEILQVMNLSLFGVKGVLSILQVLGAYRSSTITCPCRISEIPNPFNVACGEVLERIRVNSGVIRQINVALSLVLSF